MDNFFLDSRNFWLTRSTFYIFSVFPLNVLGRKNEREEEEAVNSVGRVDLRISFRFITSRWSSGEKTIASFLVVRPKSRNPHQKMKIHTHTTKKIGASSSFLFYFQTAIGTTTPKGFSSLPVQNCCLGVHFHNKMVKLEEEQCTHTQTVDPKCFQRKT